MRFECGSHTRERWGGHGGRAVRLENAAPRAGSRPYPWAAGLEALAHEVVEPTLRRRRRHCTPWTRARCGEISMRHRSDCGRGCRAARGSVLDTLRSVVVAVRCVVGLCDRMVMPWARSPGDGYHLRGWLPRPYSAGTAAGWAERGRDGAADHRRHARAGAERGVPSGGIRGCPGGRATRRVGVGRRTSPSAGGPRERPPAATSWRAAGGRSCHDLRSASLVRVSIRIQLRVVIEPPPTLLVSCRWRRCGSRCHADLWSPLTSRMVSSACTRSRLRHEWIPC